jgi:hypothetical protein
MTRASRIMQWNSLLYIGQHNSRIDMAHSSAPSSSFPKTGDGTGRVLGIEAGYAVYFALRTSGSSTVYC